MTAEQSLLDRRAALDEARILHDPRPTAPMVCPECDVRWPCPTRLAQRVDKRKIDRYLDSDLYGRSALTPDDPPGIRRTNPLGWSVWLTYGFETLLATIRTPDGEPFASTTHATVEWLEEVLP